MTLSEWRENFEEYFPEITLINNLSFLCWSKLLKSYSYEHQLSPGSHRGFLICGSPQKHLTKAVYHQENHLFMVNDRTILECIWIGCKISSGNPIEHDTVEWVTLGDLASLLLFRKVSKISCESYFDKYPLQKETWE